MPDIEELLRRQAGVVARRQLLECGVDSDRVRNQIRASRWVELTPRVIGTTTGVPTWHQRLWVAVLHAGPRSVLGSLSAAGYLGLAGWPRPHVSVLVDDELSFEPVDGVDFFRTRRPFELLRDSRPGVPTCRLEPAILLFAAYEAPIRAAHGVLAAVVQQRLTTPTRLLAWVDQLHPLRRARSFRQTLASIEGGAHSVAELDVRRMCRRHNLALPDRQQGRRDRAGRQRWTDCEWDLPGGDVLVLEVDGSFHAEVTQWAADIKRSRALTTRHRLVIRCTAYELRYEDAEVAADLVALGVRHRSGVA